MKWFILKGWYKFMLMRVEGHDKELDAMYAAEKARNAFALKHYTTRLENVEQDRVRAALGRLPI